MTWAKRRAPIQRSGEKKHSGRAVRRKPGEMNGAERRYANRLEGLRQIGAIESYQFDALKLRLAEKTFYEPDFLVIAKDGAVEFHEVKAGWKAKGTLTYKIHVEDDAAVKFKVAAAAFPFRFRMVWFNEGNGNWEEHMFLNDGPVIGEPE